MAVLHKLGLLLWKNMKMIQRHWLVTTFEMLIPIGLFALLAWIKSQVPPGSAPIEKPASFVEQNSIDDIIDLFPSPTVLLYYTPANNFTMKLMENVRAKLVFSKQRLMPLSSESELETLHNLLYANSTIEAFDMFGVIFEEADEIPKNFKYKIRSSSAEWQTSSLFPQYQHPGPMESSELYFRSGFIALQYVIDASYLNMIRMLKNVSDKKEYPYGLQEFPYPKYTQQSDASMVFSILSVFISFGFVISICMNLLKQIVADKRTGVTELMKLMGLTRWMLWFSWLLKILMVNIIVITVIVFLIKTPFNPDAGSFIEYSNAFLVWIFLVLFCVAATVFMFFISTLFYRPVLATCFGAIIWSASYFAPKDLLSSYKSGLALKLLSAIFPNMAMHWGFTVIGTFESAQIGANWSNLFKSPSGSASDVRMGAVLLMLIFDILFYGLLTAYTDAIFPGHYGVAQPWNFFLTKSFWLSRKVGVTQTAYGSAEEIQKNFEAPLHGLKPGIRIKNLHKTYNSGKVAVDGVTLDFYQDQITALLGHNGAGKTTTMSILTGMLPPTSGSVFVNDYDIRYDLAKVRESLGLCPQHDMLFNELTVMEHLVFFGMLKGLSRQKATTEASVLLTQIQLSEKANSMSSQLSGGMKRKVSLGIALIGGSKVVILDEPTSGLDPEARRHIWDLLLSMRGHRTIIITTHFMEEADVLGDRIAIMDHGKVQCYGTSLFLKNQYGAGYMLKLMVKEHCDVDNITHIVESFISNAKVKSKLGTELSYTLPSEQKSHYPELFDAIENKKEELGIASIGVSITTMEEVFLKVGKMASEDNKTTTDELPPFRTLSRSSSLVSLEGKQPRGKSFVFQQLEAVFTKKLVFMYRKWIVLSIQAVITILMTAAALKLSVFIMSVGHAQEPSIAISLPEYGNTDVLYYVPQGGPVALARSYEDLVRAAGSTPISVPEPIVSDMLVNENETALANELAKVGEKDISYFRERLIVAAMFNITSGNAMYSSIALHGAAISVNLMNNALLKSLTNSSDYFITTLNHPLKFEPLKRTAPAKGVAIILQQFIPLGILYLLGYFLIFPLLERVSNAKQLQLMTGLSPVTYWFPCFVCDFSIFTLVSLLMVLMLPIVDTNGFFGGAQEMGVFILLLVMYGLSGIPFAYVFSYLAKTYANGFGLFVGLNFVIGSILPWVVVLLEVLWATESLASVNVFKKFLFLLPQFSFSYGLAVFFEQAVHNNWCHASVGKDMDRLCAERPLDECCAGSTVATVSYLGCSTEIGKEGLGWPLLFMFIDTFLYISIIMLVDFGLVSYAWEGLKKLTRPKEEPSSQDEIDGDVKIEYTRVQTEDGDVLAVNDLVKVYGWKSLAVKGISFGVMPGECFGLLGVNGAGKTTTFKMLTGAEIPTEGDARIDHCMLSRHKSEYLSQIGYCPQFDAFNETLTGREMLQLFARLRGVAKEDIDSEVEKWLKLLGLNEYQDCRCGTYSGGNKRKLSTAMALIADPPLIFLDEPTSGVDPVARRNLWSVLAKIQKTKHSIVLTSHSMEECEALCNRLAIMVNGQFVCIGENQYLKQKFGQGFTVMIKLKDSEQAGRDQVANVQEAVERVFPACVLKDKHQGLLHYHLTDPHIPWKVLFFNMEKLKADHTIIEDYTISETTLEQLFLAFAQAGEDNTTESRV